MIVLHDPRLHSYWPNTIHLFSKLSSRRAAATKNYCTKLRNAKGEDEQRAHAQGALPEHVVGDGGEVLPSAPAARPASRAGSRRRRRQLPLALDTHVHGGWRGACAHWLRPTALKRSIGLCACAYSLGRIAVRAACMSAHAARHLALSSAARGPCSRRPRPPFRHLGSSWAWEWSGSAGRVCRFGPCRAE